jgi:hypothetical protein
VALVARASADGHVVRYLAAEHTFGAVSVERHRLRFERGAKHLGVNDIIAGAHHHRRVHNHDRAV